MSWPSLHDQNIGKRKCDTYNNIYQTYVHYVKFLKGWLVINSPVYNIYTICINPFSPTVRCLLFKILSIIYFFYHVDLSVIDPIFPIYSSCYLPSTLFTLFTFIFKSEAPLSLVLGGILTHNLPIFGQTPNPSCLWVRQEDSYSSHLTRTFMIEAQVWYSTPQDLI